MERGASASTESPQLAPDAAYRADPKPPFSTTQFAYEIAGVHTEFILSSYSNVLFFSISQLGKLGSLLLARRDETLDGEASYSVTSLLGKKDSACEIYARRIIEITSARSPKPLVLALALTRAHEDDPAVFRAICAIVDMRTR